MKYEYEAVSGNQDVFKFCHANDVELAVISEQGNLTFPGREHLHIFGGCLIAERKVKEKYIPKEGDVFRIIDKKHEGEELLCIRSNDDDVAFDFLDSEDVCFDMISTDEKFEFIRKHDDKAANPVNFTSEKYVPRVGDIFAVSSKDDGQFNPNVFHCILNVDRAKNDGSGKHINARCDNNSNVFASLHLDMNDFHLIHRPSTK